MTGRSQSRHIVGNAATINDEICGSLDRPRVSLYTACLFKTYCVLYEGVFETIRPTRVLRDYDRSGGEGEGLWRFTGHNTLRSQAAPDNLPCKLSSFGLLDHKNAKTRAQTPRTRVRADLLVVTVELLDGAYRGFQCPNAAKKTFSICFASALSIFGRAAC